MVKKKTSIMIDEDTWKAFIVYAVHRTGSTRKIGEQVEEALKNHMISDRSFHGLEGESFVCMTRLSRPDAREILKEKAKEGYITVAMRMWKH